MSRKDDIEQIIEPAVAALGFELLGIDFITQGRHSLIRLYIDSDNGVDVENCADVSRQVSAVLDVEDPINGEYTLEVSSPGIERPLFKPEHFTRVIDQIIAVRLSIPLNGRRKFKGELTEVREDGITIVFDDSEIRIGFNEIDKANLVARWK
jgi:ribosome maturation factor RimP